MLQYFFDVETSASMRLSRKLKHACWDTRRPFIKNEKNNCLQMSKASRNFAK